MGNKAILDIDAKIVLCIVDEACKKLGSCSMDVLFGGIHVLQELGEICQRFKFEKFGCWYISHDLGMLVDTVRRCGLLIENADATYSLAPLVCGDVDLDDEIASAIRWLISELRDCPPRTIRAAEIVLGRYKSRSQNDTPLSLADRYEVDSMGGAGWRWPGCLTREDAFHGFSFLFQAFPFG